MSNVQQLKEVMDRPNVRFAAGKLILAIAAGVFLLLTGKLKNEKDLNL